MTPEAPRGILSYEFAGTPERAARIVGSWSAEAREQAMLSLGLDYLYLCVYPAWFALACGLIARRSPGAVGRIGVGLSWLVLLAGPLDALENAALIELLRSAPSQAAPRVAQLCAAPKFALIGTAAGYLLCAGAMRLAKRRRRSIE